jgi:hypothetical protein
MDLQRHNCRYILWASKGPDVRYCGHQKVEGSSYCAEHEALCRPKALTKAANDKLSSKIVEGRRYG